MLSAIAARKAAQASRQETHLEQSTSAIPTPSPPLDPHPVSRPVSKRKSRSRTPSSTQKKKQKLKRPEGKTVRYFEEQNPSGSEDDIVVIDSDEREESGDLDLHHTFEPIASTSKRGWSPSIPVNDSSDEEGDEPKIPDVPITMPTRSPVNSQRRVLSTFQPVLGQNTFFLTSDEALTLNLSPFSESSATILSLAPTETICLLGTYSFAVLYGAISISGVVLRASQIMQRVFAPRSSPLPVLECLSEDKSEQNAPNIPQRLQILLKNEGAIVVLQESRTGVEGLGQICKTFDGVFEPPRWQKDDTESHLRISGTHMLVHQGKDLQPFLLPSSWESALSSASLNDVGLHAGVYLVKGPKKSGKSTFARTLLNQLLTRYQKVAFLECDLGQSEFTPGGMVALNIIDSTIFGPSFTHPTLPNVAHYIGQTTPKSSPSHYLLAIQSLLQSYRLDVQTPLIDVSKNEDDARISDIIPLVVNTMGWTKGLGADLNRKIEDIVDPTDIFEFDAPVFESGWPTPTPSEDYPRTHENDARLHLLKPIPTSVLTTNYSPADHRSISILSYFHALFPNTAPRELEQVSAIRWDTSLPLCAHPPYEVDWSLAFEKIILVGAGTEDVVPSEIERVLNGAIVGLVSCEPGSMDPEIEESMSTSRPVIPYTQGSSAPSPSISTCHGLALIRSISPISSHMHILTPLPPHLLAKGRVVVKGPLELPIWGMLDFRTEGETGGVAGVDRNKVPYLQWGKGEGIGGERRRVRRNLMRKAQM